MDAFLERVLPGLRVMYIAGVVMFGVAMFSGATIIFGCSLFGDPVPPEAINGVAFLGFLYGGGQCWRLLLGSRWGMPGDAVHVCDVCDSVTCRGCGCRLGRVGEPDGAAVESGRRELAAVGGEADEWS